MKKLQFARSALEACAPRRKGGGARRAGARPSVSGPWRCGFLEERMRAGEHDAGRNPGAWKKEIGDIFRAAALLI